MCRGNLTGEAGPWVRATNDEFFRPGLTQANMAVGPKSVTRYRFAVDAYEKSVCIVKEVGDMSNSRE